MAKFTAKSADVYDDSIVRRVPGYRLGQELTTAYLLAHLPDDAHVLVVGAGTGAELLLMAEQAPGWRFTAVDPSEGMLEVAREKLAEKGWAERVEFHATAMEATAGLPEHHAAVGLLVSQFVPDDGSKSRFYRNVANALATDAPFITIDFIAGDESTRAAYRRWAIMGGARETEADSMMKRLAENWHPIERPRMLEFCAEAGLSPPRHYFQALTYAGHIFTRKAPDR